MEGKAVGVETSLTKAEVAVEVARANYEEVSQRVLREVDRFRKENAATMYATMLEFAKAQKEHNDKMNDAWGALVPQLESVNVAEFSGSSFVQAAAVVKEKTGGFAVGGSVVDPGVQPVIMQVQGMPSQPPPPEPTVASNGIHGMIGVDTSTLNGTVRYREPLPPEE